LQGLWDAAQRGAPAVVKYLQDKVPEKERQELQSTKNASNTTRTGITRKNRTDWKATRDLWDELGYGEVLSGANRKLIKSNRTPRVDAEWIAIHPEDAGLIGERISMHHVQALPLTVPLPKSRHVDVHMPGGYQRNTGGPGSQLPIYLPPPPPRPNP
jgi:filamentous hemagglutinin